MKIDRSGPPDVSARISPSAPEPAGPKKPLPRGLFFTGAIVLLAALAAFLARRALLEVIVTRGLGMVTGYRISVGPLSLGSTESVFRDVRVATKDGDPLLDARRLVLRYSLGGLLVGGAHRYGLSGITIDGGVFSVVRRADGSYNLGSRIGGGAGNGGASGPPWNLDVRVRDSELRLIDRAPVAADLAEQRITQLIVVARIRPQRSRATGSAVFVSRETGGAPARTWPLALHAQVDYPRGVAMLRIGAAQFPVRGPLGFLLHSPAVRVDDGIFEHLGFTLFALDIATDRPLEVHAGGTADVRRGRLRVAALRRPVRDVRGHITLVDDGLWATRLDANLAGIPIVARGGIFDRQHPTLRLGVRGSGDLHALRRAFAFSQDQPVRGGVEVQTLLEAPVANILVRSALHVGQGSYGKVPLANIDGRVDYHAGAVVLDGVRGRYGASAVNLGGRFLLGGPVPDSAIVVAAGAPGRAIPYGENIAPQSWVGALALISGSTAGYRARGTLGISAGGVSGAGMFAVDERGVGEFGPFVVARSDGSSLVGALRLERPTSRSAAWLSARNYRIDVPVVGTRFPGLNVPAFPPVAGTLDGELAGAGAPDGFMLTGDLRGRNLRVGTAQLGTGRVRLGGTLADVRLENLQLDGPLGQFSGSAAAARGAFALRGAYRGSLDRLIPLTGPQQAHGAVRGDVRATFNGPDVVVQSSGAALRRGSVRGVALDAAAGTIAVRRNGFHLLVGTGSIAGRHAVARESGGIVAVSAPDIPSAALRGTGLPLDAGNVSAYGVADLRAKAPSFDGTVTVAAGRVHGYRVAGDARIELAGARARVVTATGALGSTYGSIGGDIAGFGAGALRYDLDARVPLGDIGLLRRDLGVPLRNIGGSFAAQLHVHGEGGRPVVDGDVQVPEGVYNGLAFRSARARVALPGGGISARDGTVTVGTTKALVAASSAGGAFRFDLRSAAVDLADFNDYFDASNTLAGHGPIALSLSTYGNRVTTNGALDLDGLRYRSFPFGRTVAHWQMRGSAVAARATLDDPAGSLVATASIVPGSLGDPFAALRAARYDLRARLAHIDLGTWLPAAGLSTPILGSVDANFTVTGRLPQLTVNADAALSNATIAGYAVSDAHVRARSTGSRINVIASSANLGFAQLAGSGRVGLASNDPLAFDLRLTTDDIGQAARAFVPAARGVDLAGALDADVRVGGSRARPTIQGGFDLRGARYGNFIVPRTIGALALAGRAIELRDVDVEFARGVAFVAGSLPLTVQPFGLGPPRAPLSFDVTARDVDLAQFSPLLPAGTKLGGIVDGRFGVEGTVNRPRLLGSLAVLGGSYSSSIERTPITNIGAQVAFSGSSIALQTFHADAGGGTLDGSGRLILPLGNEPRVRYDAGVSAKSVKLDFPAYGRGTVDGQLRLNGSGTSPTITGDLALRDAVVPVSAVYGNGLGAGGAGGARTSPLNPTFRLHVAADDNVRVRSSIVDIGTTGAVDLTGTLRAPQLAGEFTATDGTISSYNHVFRLVNATVTFDPADGVVPTVQARAFSRVTNPDPDPSRNIAGSANIIVNVSGTADSNNLQVSYSSDPPYSQEQIIGLLLDVPALLGAVNFNLNGGPGGPYLRGAPGETNALLPPGVTPEQVSAISFNQEVFSLLNGQFTQRALSPVERIFEKTLGLSDVEFTVDYGGGLGYSLRRQIGKRDFYTFLSQTVTYPNRVNVGFELEPKAFQSINFSYYQQNGVTSLITNQTPGQEIFGSNGRLTSVQPLGNRSGLSLNFNWRF